jgi:hypothetical protein
MADLPGLKKHIENYLAPPLKKLLNILEAKTSAVHNPSVSANDREEYTTLAALSARHKTDFYLFSYYQQNPHLVPADHVLLLRERMTRQAIRSLQQLNELISICKNFNTAELPYAIIKGPHLARMLYGTSAVKVSVDLDILMVHPEDLFGFHNVFLHAGYTCYEQKLLKSAWKQKLYIAAKRELHYFNRIAGYAVDLHVKPFANTILTNRRHRNFFSDLERIPFEGITIPVLPPEKYFVYLCHHGACHQFARLGWLMDIRNFYDQRKEILVMDKILSVAGSMNTKRSVTLAFYILEVLFHDPVPEKIKHTTDHSGTLEWLAVNCLKAVSHEKGEGLTLKARFDRIVYLVILTKGFAGKVDVVLSVLLRHMVMLLFGPKKEDR